MSVEVPPTRVPDHGPPTLVALGVLVASLALVVAAGVVGREPAPQHPLPPASPSRPAAAVAAKTPSATPPLTASPTSTPLATPRAGVPTVTVGTAHVLSESRAPVPSGIETLSGDPGWFSRTVADGRGVLWSIGAGRLARYDPASGKERTWTIDDDTRFAATDIVPAQAGGVWLVGARTLRRFDGAGFVTGFDVGVDIVAAAEGPDGSPWVATADGTVVHLVGSSRTSIDALRPDPNAAITALAIDSAGFVWCGWAEWTPDPRTTDGWVARFSSGSWDVFHHITPLRSPIRAITALGYGAVMVLSDVGLARFGEDTSTDIGGWTDLRTEAPVANVTSVAAGADGSAWLVGADPNDGAVSVARLQQQPWTLQDTWTLFGPSDGLPGSTENAWVGPTIVAAQGRVFVGTGAGIYALTGRRWQRRWAPPQAAGPTLPAQSVVGVSREEAWSPSGGTVWHFARGTWSQPPALPPWGYSSAQLVRTGAGTLWATMAHGGAFVLRGTTWTNVAAGDDGGIAVDGDGTVWVAGPTPSGSPPPYEPWAVESFSPAGTGWNAQRRTPLTDLIPSPTHLAIGADGTIWVGSDQQPGTTPSGLASYANGRWEAVHPRGGDVPFAVWDLAVAPDGDVWVAGTDLTGSSDMPTFGQSWVARFDGTRWVVFGAGDGPRFGSLTAIAAAPDGTVWATTADGLAHYNGTSWTTLFPGLWPSDVSVAPDGTVWVSGSSGVARLAASVTSR